MTTATIIRLAAFAAFAYLFSFGTSGPFMFDNNFISYYCTSDLDWHWQYRVEVIFEWFLFAVIAGGFLLFTLRIPERLPRSFTIRQVFLGVTVACLVALLTSIELREYNSQQAVAEKFARQGGSITFANISTMFSGNWFERIVLLLGVTCSFLGMALALFDKRK